MPDGRHLDVAAVLPVQHGQPLRLVEDDWLSNTAPAFQCPACDDIVGTLIWCLDGAPRCVECAMAWRPGL